MKTSEKKKLASRENGKRSSGPRTDAGKTVAKLNATKHGILSSADTESDSISFLEVYNPLAEEYAVTTPTQEFLVRQLALTMLRLKRCARFEADILREAFLASKDPRTASSDKLFEKLAVLGERYESRLVNRLMRILQELRTG